MDVRMESIPNDHTQEETASHKKKRPKINGAAEPPPAKRIKSSPETLRSSRLPRVPRTTRASTARARGAQSGDSKWCTVTPPIVHQVHSDPVLVDMRPRLWAMDRAELGSAFVEISDSKCINSISWTLTDMPVVILDDESMVLEKPKGADSGLSMDLVLIREFHDAHPKTPQKDEDTPPTTKSAAVPLGSASDHSNLPPPSDSPGAVHSPAATPSLHEEAPSDPSSREVPERAVIKLSTAILPPILESKPREILQKQGTIPLTPANESLSKIAPPSSSQKELEIITTEAHSDPITLVLSENDISKSKQGRRLQKALRKPVHEPLLKPVHHASHPVPITSAIESDTPKRKRGRPPKQSKLSCGSAIDSGNAVSRSQEQEKPVKDRPSTSNQTLDLPKPTVIPTTKSKREKYQPETSPKSTDESFPDTARAISQPRGRKKAANETFLIPGQVSGSSNSPAAPTTKGEREKEQPEMPLTNDSLDSAQGASRLAEQKKPNHETQPVATPTSDLPESASSVGTSKPGAGKSMRKLRKALGPSADESLPRQLGPVTRSSARTKSREEGKQRRDPEGSVREPLESGYLSKSEREGAQRSQNPKRNLSPGPSVSTSTRTRKSNLGRKQRMAGAGEQRPKNTLPVPPKKEEAKSLMKPPPSALAPGGERKSVLASLRFTKNKSTTVDTLIPKDLNNLPTASFAPTFVPAQIAPIGGGALDHSNDHLLRGSHLNREAFSWSTPMFDLENMMQHPTDPRPALHHYPDSRNLPYSNKFALHGTLSGAQNGAGEIANVEVRTRNQMDTRCDESQAFKHSPHVDFVDTCRCWTPRGEPPCPRCSCFNSNQIPTGGLVTQKAPWRALHAAESVATQAKFEDGMRGARSDYKDIPLAQIVHRTQRASRPDWPRLPRAHTHSPVPTLPWTTAHFDQRSRSVPYSKPPPLGPRARVELQVSNSGTPVTGLSDDRLAHNHLANASNSRELSSSRQGGRSGSTAAAGPTRFNSTVTTPSVKDATMVSLEEPPPPAPHAQLPPIVAPDSASLSQQMHSKPHTPITPTISSAIDITIPAGETPPSCAPVPIEQKHVSTGPSHTPEIPDAMGISMESSADKPAPSPLSIQPLPLTSTVLSPSLKRKGKEKATVPEDPDDEPSSSVQDEVHQAKKAKLCHDPKVDVSRLGDLIMPVACSSKTKLEDSQPSGFSETPALTSAMAVDTQSLSLSVTSSPVKPAKRRGRPPKGANAAPSSSRSPKTNTLASARNKQDGHQHPPVSSSTSFSSSSPEPPTQASVVAVEESLAPPSASTATKAVKRRKRPPQTADVESSNSLPVFTITSGSTIDDPPSISSLLQTKSQVEPSITPAAPVQWSENGVPLPIPVEIQALIDAYINGAPIAIFASSSHLQGFWGFKMSRGKEVGYAFMGFYRVRRVLESLDEGEMYEGKSGRDKKGKGKAVGASEVSRTRVRWRFKLRWEPGGEGWQIRDPQRLTSPWWNSKLKARELAVMPRTSSEDSDDETTLPYRLARRGSQNFSRRHCYFDQTFCSVLPLHLLAPVNAEIPDVVLPRGWHCPDCGKLNFRYYLRHRRCDSSYCQGKPLTQGYVVEIDRLRDPQQGTPLALPLNSVPGHIRANSRIQVWNDKMKTLIYGCETGTAAGMARVQHIFTCNLSDLQRAPSEMFNSIQMDVPLRRPTGDGHANPYFVHSVSDVSGKFEDSSSWITAPHCLHHAREVMNHRGRKYGKKTAAELDISKLIIRAWVTSGSKRGSDLLQAKERCVVVMCLGCEVILSISPKSAMTPNDDQTRLPDLDTLIPIDSLDPQEDQLAKSEPRDSVKLDLGGNESQLRLVPAPSTVRGAAGKNQKGEKVEMTLGLVHGDVVILEGDDFEYSIKRTGTSILLFGS